MAREDSARREARQRRGPWYGGALIVLLLTLGVLIFFLDDIISAFERDYELVALVPDAPGIAAGTPVWVSGRRAGKVERVAILPSSLDTLGRVAVTMRLPVHVQQQIREDSRVRITAVNLMSEAVIDILPGTPQAPMKQPGDTLRREARLTAEQLTERAALVRADLDTVLATLGTLAPVAQTRMAEAQRALAGMDAAMIEVQRLRADLAANPGVALMRDPAFQASLERARAHAAALPGVVADLRERAVDAARASLDSLMAEVRRNPLRFVF